MKTVLRSSDIQLEISHFWAEIISLLFKKKEFLYQKVRNFWQRQSPVLFPIVGKVKNDQILVDGQYFPISQHGFARDMNFTLIEKTGKSAIFELRASKKTKTLYPFDFVLQIQYFIHENNLVATYTVQNPSDKNLYFSLWAHPAWKLEDATDKYSICFYSLLDTKIHRLEWWFLSKENCENFIWKTFELSEQIFENDALIFQQIGTRGLDLFYKKEKQFSFEWEGFLDFGIWKQPDAPFICLEPWVGYASECDFDGEFPLKKWVQKLWPYEERKFSWRIIF